MCINVDAPIADSTPNQFEEPSIFLKKYKSISPKHFPIPLSTVSSAEASAFSYYSFTVLVIIVSFSIPPSPRKPYLPAPVSISFSSMLMAHTCDSECWIGCVPASHHHSHLTLQPTTMPPFSSLPFSTHLQHYAAHIYILCMTTFSSE